MDHAITIGEVLTVAAIFGGVILVLALIYGAICLMNPFSSGH